jgi:hypothetical protein
LFERNYDEQGRRLSWDHGKAKYYVDEQRQESVGPGTINEGGAIVTGIEIIEADLKSIHEAQRCLESMKSLQGDRDLRRDFDIVWMDLTTLRTRLQRKLDRLKSEGGAR